MNIECQAPLRVFLKQNLRISGRKLEEEEANKILSHLTEENGNGEKGGLSIRKRPGGYSFSATKDNITTVCSIASNILKREVEYHERINRALKNDTSVGVAERLSERGFRERIQQGVNWIRENTLNKYDLKENVSGIYFKSNGGIRFFRNKTALSVLDSEIDGWIKAQKKSTKSNNGAPVNPTKRTKRIPGLYTLTEIVSMASKSYNVAIDDKIIGELKNQIDENNTEDGFYKINAVKEVYLISQTGAYKDASKREATRKLKEEDMRGLVGRTLGRGWQFEGY